MKSERARVSMIYILTGVILLLVVYLLLFTYKTLKPEEKEDTKKNVVKMPEVAASCTFDMTASTFDSLENQENLCSSLNRINISGVEVQNKKMNIIVFYRPGISSKNTGVYINDNKITNIANENVKYNFISKNDHLFMTTITNDRVNIVAYSKDVMPSYNLEQTLNNLQIEDTVLNTVLSTINIDGNSIQITDEAISFNSTSKTCTNNVSGVNYNIKFTDNTFENPVAIANVAC